MRYLPDLTNTYWVDISHYSDKELLEFYDNPNNFYIKDCRNDLYNNNIPSNFLLSLTHWSYDIPSWFEKNFVKNDNTGNLRLLKNFSDWWTTPLVNSMDLEENQIVRTQYSRVIWDCNRDINDYSENGFLRKTDFWGIKLFNNIEWFRNKGEQHHIHYHTTIENKLLEIEKSWKKSFLFDIHDTWVLFMWEDTGMNHLDKELFPLISLADVHGTSCDRDILDYLILKIDNYLWIKAEINTPFKWWYITKSHWSDYRWILDNVSKRNVIQIEIGRFLYMKESTQELDEEKVRILWEWLKRVICDVVRKFS